ncbi:hypothetical protein PFISCL1PPCAC_27607, partial [Pristionchus fissidentatus]
MRLKLLLICSLLGAAVHADSYKQDYKCLHDGYSNSDGKCVCTKNDFMNFYSGSTCKNIQCTNTGVVNEEDGAENRCLCPPGFLGTHCEPVQCVPGDVRSFNELSHGRGVSVIITYNKEFQDQVTTKDKSTNLPKVVCDAINGQEGVSVDSKIHIWLMETDILTTVGDCEEDVQNSIIFCSDVPDGKGGHGTVKSCEGDLTASYINDAMTELGEDSRLIILSNEGITDENPEEDLEAIRKKAISLRIQIHSIVLSPRVPNPNSIYFNGPFKLLRGLSESTLGFFITPFDASGGQMIGKDGISSILNKMMNVFFEYVVIDRITTNTTSCNLPTDYTVFHSTENTPDFWLTVSSSGKNYAEYTTSWIGASPQPNKDVDAGFFNGYTLPAVQGELVSLKPFSTVKSGKCVPSTVMILAKSVHLARFAITNNDEDIDASSPFAISGEKNTLVGHFVNHIHEEHLNKLHIEHDSDGFTMKLDNNPTPRDCQYNAKFGEVSCDEGTNTLIRVRDRESGAAVTVQSLYCSPKDKLSMATMVSRADAETDLVECANNIEVKKDGRSLIVAAHATQKISELFNGNSKSAIRYLNDLADSGHYANYIVNIYNHKEGTDAKPARTEYDDFKDDMMSAWNNYREGSGDDGVDDCTITGMQAILPLEELTGPAKTLPNSDIIFIYDRAFEAEQLSNDKKLKELKDVQKKMYEKRLRLIVLLLGCEDDFSDPAALWTWNRIAVATGGFAVHFKEANDLNEFLASYVDWVKGEPAAAMEVNQPLSTGFYFNDVPSTPFQATAGNNYTILVNSNPPVSNVFVSKTGQNAKDGEDLVLTKTLGNSLYVLEYTATEDASLVVTAHPRGYFFYGSIRVLDQSDQFATIGFTEKECLDKAYPDMNPKIVQYPATIAEEEAKVSMTLFDSTGAAFKSDSAAETKGTNYHLDYFWKCSDDKNLFFITSDVATTSGSFTRVVTTQCFGSGDKSDKCINGDYIIKTDSCLCPHQYTGDACDMPVCQNGGSITASLECKCTDDYEGDFCQKFKKCGDVSTTIPQFKSIANTVIFLVERSNFVKERLTKITTDQFTDYRASQYIIAQYVNETSFDVLISTTDKGMLFGVLSNIESAEEAPGADPVAPITFDAVPAIKAALQAQTTDSALLVWFAKDDSIDDFIPNLFEPIALNRVYITAFFGTSKIDTPVHPITLAGGSIFYSNGLDDYTTVFSDYLAPALEYGSGFEYRLNTLSISTSCKANHTINIDKYTSKIYVAANKGSVEKQLNGAASGTAGDDFPGGMSYDLPAAGQYLISIKNEDTDENCTSSVVALSLSQVAYGFVRHEGSDKLMAATEKGDNLLVTYWMAESLDAAPSATINSLSLDGSGESTEVFMTVRDECSFTLSIPINCTGVDAYGVKITNLINAKANGGPAAYVDKYIPVICLNGRECKNGKETADGGCECDKFWGGEICDKLQCENGDIVGDSCSCYNGFSGDLCEDIVPPSDRPGEGFLFIQDVCGEDDFLKDEAQSVFAQYMVLMKTTSFYLATNNEELDVVPVATTSDLTKALTYNRAATTNCVASIGPALDKLYTMLRKPSQAMILAVGDPIGSVNVAHVTTVQVDRRTGSLDKLNNEYTFNMAFVGITYKNEYFVGAKSFDQFEGIFSQTYDTVVALLDITDAFTTDIKVTTPVPDYYRCVQNLQSAFLFHNDISSVPQATEFRAKAQKIVASVTKYFTIPSVSNIDTDDDTCWFDTEQEKDVTLFSGSLYANGTGISVPTFCMSNMNSYPGSITKADYKQLPQVNMSGVIAYYSKWYANKLKMDCHCFDFANPNTTSIILWSPLSPTSVDDIKDVSFDSFKMANFTHIVMPFGFNYDDSPLWRKLVPDRGLWLKNVNSRDVNDVIQDIWTIVCQLAGRIDHTQTAEPFSYMTDKERSLYGNDGSQKDFDSTDEPVTDSDSLSLIAEPLHGVAQFNAPNTCSENLQAAFVFHNDISSVPRATEFKTKAQIVIANIPKHFTVPSVYPID